MLTIQQLVRHSRQSLDDLGWQTLALSLGLRLAEIVRELEFFRGGLGRLTRLGQLDLVFRVERGCEDVAARRVTSRVLGPADKRAWISRHSELDLLLGLGHGEIYTLTRGGQTATRC